MTKFINIVLTADNNYTDVIAITMYSIVKNLSKNNCARFFIFSQNFNQKDIRKLKKLESIYNCKIINIPVEQYLNLFDFINIENFRNKWISLACYFRLLLFKFLPDDVENVFYIDGDMIIDCDLSDIELQNDKMFAATIEPWAMQHTSDILKHCFELEEFKKFVENPLKYPYFNAGFFCVNLRKTNKKQIFEQIMDLLKKYPTLPYCDQDLLNMIFGQKYSDFLQILPPEYNIFTNVDYDIVFDKLPYSDKVLKKATKYPKIYHFAGADKPWETTQIRYFYNKWWDYMKQYPFRFSSKYYKSYILNNIFSVKNEYMYKIITILGIKFRFKLEDVFSIKNELSHDKLYNVITICGIKFKFKKC